jgi:hypothetical protein
VTVWAWVKRTSAGLVLPACCKSGFLDVCLIRAKDADRNQSRRKEFRNRLVHKHAVAVEAIVRAEYQRTLVFYLCVTDQSVSLRAPGVARTRLSSRVVSWLMGNTTNSCTGYSVTRFYAAVSARLAEGTLASLSGSRRPSNEINPTSLKWSSKAHKSPGLSRVFSHHAIGLSV